MHCHLFLLRALVEILLSCLIGQEQARYEDHRLIHDLLVQNAAIQHELQESRHLVTALEQERSRRGEKIVSL
ncbi:hypothetical protein Tco_0241888 [Tanacetum coccineum]